jgi:DNA-binding transcriptional regulator YhcF (GntR family)
MRKNRKFIGRTNDRLAKIAKDNKYTNANNGFTIIPHKIKRCLGLDIYEKALLECLLSYMWNSNKCYPAQERLALHMSCSSKTVERHLKSLVAKNFIIIDKTKKNNEYYLSDNLHENPYLLLSEKTYEFMNSVRGQVNSGNLDRWVAEVVKSEKYKEFITKLEETLSRDFNLGFVENEIREVLQEYRAFMEKEFEKKFNQK